MKIKPTKDVLHKWMECYVPFPVKEEQLFNEWKQLTPITYRQNMAL